MNIGERVGDYEIVQVLGAGGMGQVYKVRNVLSHRIEAMKVLLPNLGGEPGVAERFLREIQVQATLDHPNIARLQTAYMAGDQLVMILEFVDGSTIEKLLEHGTLGVRESIHYTQQVLEALAYAHERGVVHRDIKPANIMRTAQGNIKLMDFGIARMQQDRKLTQTGSTVGSLYYMSPEQIRGSQPDPRSDLYSLGVTLYEMVTGRRPFEGQSDYTIMAAHLQQPPVAPIDVVPGVPQEVNDIILMAIAKEPGQRFQSARAFHGALASLGIGAAAVQAPADRTAIAASVPPQFSAPAGPPTLPHSVVPAPQFVPAPAAFPPLPPARSRRGLYMTLGSIATVAVIALAIFAAPRFLHTGAANPGLDPPGQSAGAAASTQQPAQAPDIAPGTSNAAPPNAAPPESVLPAEPVVARPAGNAPPVRPAAQQQPAAQGGQAGQLLPPQQAAPQQAAPPQAPPRQATLQQAAPQAPLQATPAPAQQQPPARPVEPADTTPRRVTPSAELRALREDHNLLAVRASAARAGLRTMEAQMRRQGLDLRGDIVEAETRMDYLMKESLDSIVAGDAASGRRNLQMAERALETVEKFLGR